MGQDDLAAVLHEVLVAAAELLHADKGSVQIYDTHSYTLKLVSAIGFEQDFLARFQMVKASGITTCAAALRRGERVIVENLSTHPDFTEFARVAASYGAYAAQSTPFFGSDGKIFGMISTFSDQPHCPSGRELQLLDLYAQQAARRIEGAESKEKLRQSEERLRMVLSAGKFGHWRRDLASLDLISSAQCKADFGRGPDEPFTYAMFRAAIHPDDQAMVEAAVSRAIKECGDYEADYRCFWPDGSIHWINARGRAPDNGSGRAAQIVGVTLDITERKQAEALLAGQKRVLEMLTTGADLAKVLATLIRVIEKQSEGLFGSILIRQPDSNCFFMGVAPSFPESYTKALQQASISPPYLGPCSRATHCGEAVMTADIATDPRWSEEWRNLVLGFGLRTCYSSPISAANGKVLGSFGMYYRELRDPNPPGSQLLETATYLAGIAIEHRQAERALQEADRRKDEFLAMLAHELRNPLAPILNAVQLLRLTEGDGEVIQSASEIMERQIGQIVRLVDDLLDVSRITRGKIELRQERVELASAVNHAVEATRPLVQSLNHGLTVTLPPQPIYLCGDSTRLAQIIGNLLNNACKFTAKGGHIWLTIEHQGEQAIIRVRDTGIGITAEQSSYIFEIFTQVDTSLERGQRGLGIGLTLVKQLTEMHGGTVEVHSDGDDQGSEFVVRLPLWREIPKPPSLSESKLPIKTSRRILVVDDNRDAAMSLAAWLKLISNETRIAYDGLAALETAAAFRPDVILLDIGLPKMNGYDVARRIREQPWGEKMVLVAVTGWGQAKDRQESKEAGFNNHMVKPVDHADLARLLAKLDANHSS